MTQLNQHSVFDVQKIIEALPDPIFIKTINGDFSHCNSSFAEIIGIDLSRIIGFSVADITRPEFTKACTKSDKYLLSGRYLMQSYISLIENEKTNERFSAQLIKSIYLEAPGKPLGFIVVVRSITKNTLGKTSVRLTLRETEILRLVADGKTQKNISTDLNISTHTTAHHMKSIFLKINAKNRIVAVSKAKSLELI